MPSPIIEHYYRILGVSPGVSITELKRAFRRKAVLLHPDRNKSPTAHEDFILLTEAYEYLSKGGADSDTTDTAAANGWEAAREEARERAAYYSRVRYERFIRSDYYREVMEFNEVVSQLFFFFVLVLLIALPLIGYGIYGTEGLIASGAIILLALPYIIVSVRQSQFKSWGEFINALLFLAGSNTFRFAMVTFLNLYLFSKVGLQTLIPFNWLLLIYLCSMFAGFVFGISMFDVKEKFRRSFSALCLGPLAFNLFLLVNITFSFTPIPETYDITYYKETSRSRNTKTISRNSTSMIELPGGKYDEYPGIRFFIDYNKTYNMSSITYTFKRGLFGIRVMTDYYFSQEELID